MAMSVAWRSADVIGDSKATTKRPPWQLLQKKPEAMQLHCGGGKVG